MRMIDTTVRSAMSGQRFQVLTSVEVQDADGAWRALKALGVSALDLYDGMTWREDVDTPVVSGTVRVRRDVGIQSLSPLRSDSPLNRRANGTYAPLLGLGRLIRGFAAVVPGPGSVTPYQAEAWRGRIDTIAWQDDPITITWRDLGARLQDTMIREARAYSTPDGLAVEQVMQQILTDHSRMVPVPTLVTPTSPGWIIREFEQAKGVNVLEALRALALQIGWEIRYRYTKVLPLASATPVLTFYNPLAARPIVGGQVVADLELAPSEYFAVEDMSLDIESVRSTIRCYYLDRVTQDVKWAEYYHAGSAAEHGDRYMEVSEDASSNIDSAAEATALVTSAGAALAQPYAMHRVRDALKWPLESGDVIRYQPDAKRFDTAQLYGVVALEHEISDGSGTTSILARGQPAGAYTRWLDAQGPGITVVTRSTPTISGRTVEGEADSFGRPPGTNVDGMIWIGLEWSAEVEYVDIYTIEDETDAPPPPETELAFRLRRLTGAAESNPNWAQVVGIATTPGWTRSVRLVPIGPDGRRGPAMLRVGEAVNTGTGPSSTPANLAVDRQPTSAVLTWTQTDATSVIYVWRDRQWVGSVGVGGAGRWEDTGLEPSENHVYEVFYVKSGQSSARARVGEAVAADPAAPAWAAGTPRTYTDPNLGTLVEFGWTLRWSAANQLVLEQRTPSGAWTVWRVVGNPTGLTSGSWSQWQPLGTTLTLRYRADSSTSGESRYSDARVATWKEQKTIWGG